MAKDGLSICYIGTSGLGVRAAPTQLLRRGGLLRKPEHCSVDPKNLGLGFRVSGTLKSPNRATK